MKRKKEEPEKPFVPRVPMHLVRWHCPECGIFAAGFVPVGMEGPPQVCRGNGREGGACGAIMGQVFRGAL